MPWTDQSNGRCQTSAVTGGIARGDTALWVRARPRVGSLDPGQGLAWMGWAAASGGAHGRRRGAAAGRHLAWWVTSVLADLEWPARPRDGGGGRLHGSSGPGSTTGARAPAGRSGSPSQTLRKAWPGRSRPTTRTDLGRLERVAQFARHATCTSPCASRWPRWERGGRSPRSGCHPRRRWPAPSPDRPPGDGSQSTTHCRQLLSDRASDSSASTQSASSPSWTSTLDIPRCGAQATPATCRGPASSRAPVGQGVDTALGLDRRLLGPPPRDPVGVESVPAGELDLGDPLGRRDVSVEPGDHQPGREPVLEGKRLVVHPHCEQGIAPVIGGLEGKSDREIVDRPADDLLGTLARHRPDRATRRGALPATWRCPTRSPPTGLETHDRVT